MLVEYSSNNSGGHKPRYKHDCNSCVFLGQYAIADLYACIHNGRISTVIARYSDRINDYASGLSAVREDGIVVLIEAFRLAVLKGYLPIEPYKKCLDLFVWKGTKSEELVRNAKYYKKGESMKTIYIITKKELTKLLNDVFFELREEYRGMTTGDLQTIVITTKKIKEKFKKTVETM